MLNDIAQGVVQNLLMPTQLRSEPLRSEPRVLIRVCVRPAFTALPVADGSGDQIVKQGEQECVVYKADVDKIIATMVEDDPEGIVAAEKAFRIKKRMYVRERLNGMAVPENESEWSQAMIDAGKKFTDTSVEAEFYHAHFRGIKPLTWLKVIADVEPYTQPQDVARKEDIKMIASIVQQAGQSHSDSDLRQEVAELRETIKALKAQLSQSKGK